MPPCAVGDRSDVAEVRHRFAILTTVAAPPYYAVGGGLNTRHCCSRRWSVAAARRGAARNGTSSTGRGRMPLRWTVALWPHRQLAGHVPQRGAIGDQVVAWLAHETGHPVTFTSRGSLVGGWLVRL
jgi:hypothetical protein